jgi:LacI family transcriptional regulator
VPLTSVRQPRAQLGQAAMELLMEEAGEPDSHRHRQIVFEPELVVRESTAS